MFQKWISGQDLLKRWGFRKHQLILSFKYGLQPYRYSRPFNCPYAHHETTYLIKQLDEIRDRLLDEDTPYRLGDKEEQEDILNRIKIIQNEDRQRVSWKYFVMPPTDEEIASVLQGLMIEGFDFVPDQVEEIERKLQLDNTNKKVTTDTDRLGSVFPCKPRTVWENVKIILIADDTVRIETPQGEGRFSYHELGMSHKRTGDRPTLLWGLLKLFAQNYGFISRENPNYVEI